MSAFTNGALLEDVELAGECVRLVPVHPRFAPRAFALLYRNESVLRWLLWDGPETEDELAQSFATWTRDAEDGADYRMAVLDRATDEIVGTIATRFGGNAGAADLGYWLAPTEWGRGLMSEAVRLTAHLSFRHLAARALSASVFVGNVGSRRVLEKNGFLMVHTARQNARKGDRLVDEWCFALSRHDHDACTAGWEPRIDRVTWRDGGDAPVRG